jgi:tetratricopeptide (TPR) repeat protein
MTSASEEDHVSALTLLARCHVAQEEYADAEKCCERVLAVQPQRAEALYLHGFVKMRTAIYDDAIALLERAQALAGSDDELRTDVCLALGEALERKRDFAAALQAVDGGLQLEPNRAQLLVLKGFILQRRSSRQDEAMACIPMFERALALEPSALAHLRLGFARLSLSQPDALECFEAAIKQPIGTVRYPRSLHGSAEIYLATDGPEDQQSAHLQAGYGLHRNFGFVYRNAAEILRGAVDLEPLVWKLRAICDLDLEKAQAKKLAFIVPALRRRTN